MKFRTKNRFLVETLPKSLSNLNDVYEMYIVWTLVLIKSQIP